jgi:putative membrane protein
MKSLPIEAREVGANRRPDLLMGAVAGLAGGLVASFAMDLAQRLLSSLQPSNGGGGEPATEQAANQVAQVTSGSPVPDAQKSLAGQAVHYGFGALLGLGYGVTSELWPRVTSGWGSAFGIGSALLFDEAGVPAAGLGQAPWKASASTHLYTLASHLVFGTATEGTRRLVRSAL